jgi:hypothetical protein
MVKLILTAEQRAVLNGSGEKIEVYDEQGNLLGHIEPVPGQATGETPQGGWGPFTAEEVEEALNQTDPGRPLADILADLRRQYP